MPSLDEELQKSLEGNSSSSNGLLVVVIICIIVGIGVMFAIPTIRCKILGNCPKTPSPSYAPGSPPPYAPSSSPTSSCPFLVNHSDGTTIIGHDCTMPEPPGNEIPRGNLV